MERRQGTKNMPKFAEFLKISLAFFVRLCQNGIIAIIYD
jgi:hypothetical protein